MFGIPSGKATTTMLVAGVPVTKEELQGAVSDSFHRCGFRPDEKLAENMTLDLIDLAALFEVGEIVERRGDQYLFGVLLAPRSPFRVSQVWGVLPHRRVQNRV